MAYPHKLLNPGEEIVFEGYPNWSLLFWPVVIGVLVVAGLIALLVLLPKNWPTWVLYPILVVFLLDVIAVGSRVVKWRTTSLVVTNNRIVYRHGVFRREGREIPIDRVQDVSYRQTVIERLVGAGSLTIESAGEHGQEPFPDVSHPEQMQSMINRLMEVSRQRTAAAYAPQPYQASQQTYQPSQPASIPEQIDKLSELYRRGVLTEAEFEAKKADLLRRM